MATGTHGGSHTDSVSQITRGVSTPMLSSQRGSPMSRGCTVESDVLTRLVCVRTNEPRSGHRAPPFKHTAGAVRRWWTAVTSALVLGCLAQAADVSTRTLLLDAAAIDDAVVAVGERGTILRSTDHGRQWTQSAIRTPATLTGVAFADPQHGWAVGHDAVILVTSDGGVSWARQWQDENLSDSFLDILALDAQHAIAVGAYGLYVTTTDGGHTWVRKSILKDDYHLNRISRGPTGTLYLAGEHGTLLRSNDGGAKWIPIPSPYDGSFYGLLPLGPQTLLAHGLRGRLFRSTDDGASWLPVDSHETVLLATGVKLRNGAVVLAGQARALLVSRDDGLTFVRCEVGVVTGIAELIEVSDDHLLAFGEAGVSRIPLARLNPARRQAAAAQP